MQNQRTVTIGDRTYAALIKLVGNKNPSGFVEEVLQPYVNLAENHEVAKVHSPRLADPTQIKDFQLEMVANGDS